MFLYLSFTWRFQETYKEPPNRFIRTSIKVQSRNPTTGIKEDRTLLNKSTEIFKEHYSFEQTFLYETFRFKKGDQVFVEVYPSKYINTEYSYFGFVNY